MERKYAAMGRGMGKTYLLQGRGEDEVVSSRHSMITLFYVIQYYVIIFLQNAVYAVTFCEFTIIMKF